MMTKLEDELLGSSLLLNNCLTGILGERSFNWTQWNFVSEYIENHDSEWSEKEFVSLSTGSKELKERILLLRETVNVIESLQI